MKYFLSCLLLITLMGCQMSNQDFPKIDSNGLAHTVEVGEIYQTNVRFVEDKGWTTLFEANIATKALLFEWINLEDFPELKEAKHWNAKIFVFEVLSVQEQKNSYNEIINCKILEIREI